MTTNRPRLLISVLLISLPALFASCTEDSQLSNGDNSGGQAGAATGTGGETPAGQGTSAIGGMGGMGGIDGACQGCSGATHSTCDDVTISLDEYCKNDDLCFLMIPECGDMPESRDWKVGCGLLKATWVDDDGREHIQVSTLVDANDSGWRPSNLRFMSTTEVTAEGCRNSFVVGALPECDRWRSVCDSRDEGTVGATDAP